VAAFFELAIAAIKGISVSTKLMQCRWIIAELIATGLCISVAFIVIDVPFMKYHVIAMASGQCLASFFCVWTVHHDCDQSGMLTRTLRGAMQNGITMNMFFHAEHHLFPCVPTCHLGLLAERLDHVAPEIKQTRVF
jgi:fatty acid desaturase